MYRDALRLAKPLGPCYDIYTVQCQKYQKEEAGQRPSATSAK